MAIETSHLHWTRSVSCTDREQFENMVKNADWDSVWTNITADTKLDRTIQNKSHKACKLSGCYEPFRAKTCYINIHLTVNGDIENVIIHVLYLTVQVKYSYMWDKTTSREMCIKYYPTVCTYVCMYVCMYVYVCLRACIYVYNFSALDTVTGLRSSDLGIVARCLTGIW